MIVLDFAIDYNFILIIIKKNSMEILNKYTKIEDNRELEIYRISKAHGCQRCFKPIRNKIKSPLKTWEWST